jgi:uncharacterized membrane protein
MNGPDDMRESMESVRDEVATLKIFLTRAEDRSLGYFLAAFGLSMMALAIGWVSMPNADPNADIVNAATAFGFGFTIAGLLLAFTKFFSDDPKAETPIWIELDRRRPYVHFHRREKRLPLFVPESLRPSHGGGPQGSSTAGSSIRSMEMNHTKRRGDWIAIIVVVLLMVMFLLVYYASKWSNTVTSGELLIAIATLFLAYATVLLGQHSSELTKATERLRELEQQRERRLRLQRLLQESDKAIAVETASIAPSISKGNVPQPQFNIARNIAECLGPSDDPKVRSIVLDIIGALRADLTIPAERINRASSTQDLFESLQRELRRAMYVWQGELIGI